MAVTFKPVDPLACKEAIAALDLKILLHMGVTPEMLAMGGSESDHQKALFCWAALESIRIPQLKLLFAIPNGGQRNRVTGARLKAEGVKPGVPDIMLPVARKQWHGLWIEMKAETNMTSSHQKIWLNALQCEGYQISICYTWIEARDTILTYLGEK